MAPGTDLASTALGWSRRRRAGAVHVLQVDNIVCDRQGTNSKVQMGKDEETCHWALHIWSHGRWCRATNYSQLLSVWILPSRLKRLIDVYPFALFLAWHFLAGKPFICTFWALLVLPLESDSFLFLLFFPCVHVGGKTTNPESKYTRDLLESAPFELESLKSSTRV